ncbi:alpha-xenorhabdolysin family binary toxin subunit B [Pseudomonas wadenswilerensis]
MSQPIQQRLPDIGRMNDLKEDLLAQIHAAAEGLLPALGEQLGGLIDRLLHTDRALADHVLSALVLLGNHKWDQVSGAPMEAREALEQDALRDAGRLESKGQEIAGALAALAKFRFPRVEERLDSLTAQQSALDEAIGNQTRRIEALEQQLIAMAEVIDAFNAPDLQKVFNRMIPTEAELALIQQTLLKGVSPELLVTAARTFLDKLSGVVEGRKLSELVSARSRKMIERGAMVDELCAWESRRASQQRELEQLPRISGMAGMRDQWLEQAMVLSRGWGEQLGEVKARTTLEEMAGALYGMQEYLLQVRRRYEDL